MLAEGSRQKIPGWRGVEREFFHVPQMLENPGVINRGSPGCRGYTNIGNVCTPAMAGQISGGEGLGLRDGRDLWGCRGFELEA